MKKTGMILLAVLLGCGGGETAEQNDTEKTAASSIDLSTLADPYSYVLEEVCWQVPSVYRHLQRMELVTGEEVMYTADDGTVYYSTETGEYTDGMFRMVRRFAMSQDGTELYEYDARKDEWYLREPAQPVLTVERIRTDLLYSDMIAGYAWTGEGSVSAEWARICPWAADLPLIDAGGTDVYLIVPGQDNTVTEVYRTENEENKELLYRSETGDPVLVRAGSPDRIAEAVIIITEGSRVMEIRPYHLNEPVRWDAAHDEAAMNFGSVDYLWTIEDDERIRKTLDAAVDDPGSSGLVMERGVHDTLELQYRPCWVIHFGTQQNGRFTRERTYAVSDDYHYVYIYDPVHDEWCECTD